MSCVHCSASKTAYRCASAYRNARSIAIGNNQNISFSEPLSPPAHACTANFCVLFCYRPTGRPRRNSLPLECHRNGNLGSLGTTNRTRSFQARGILPVAEDSRRPYLLPASGIVATPVHAPSSAPLLLPLILSDKFSLSPAFMSA